MNVSQLIILSVLSTIITIFLKSDEPMVIMAFYWMLFIAFFGTYYLIKIAGGW